MDSVNLASEGNSNESANRIKALGGVAERIGCTLNQVKFLHQGFEGDMKLQERQTYLRKIT